MAQLSQILLVDDNDDDCEATLRSLKKNHVVNPVHRCSNGQDALDYLYGQGKYASQGACIRPDLILLDLNMPGIDGRQVLSQLKKDENLRSIPVVVLTTSADVKDVDQCYNIGASTYIQKPVSFDGLTEAIRAMKDYWFGVAILPGEKQRAA